MGGSFEAMIPLIKPVLVNFGDEVADNFGSSFDPLKSISVAKLREEIDKLMTVSDIFLTHAWLPDIWSICLGKIGTVESWNGEAASRRRHAQAFGLASGLGQRFWRPHWGNQFAFRVWPVKFPKRSLCVPW